MRGKLIVLEGTDGSGKSTQFSLLCRRMEEAGKPFHRIVFPQYQEPSSALVRMYLGGEFGSHPDDVNAYAASTFYAVDRYASYKKVWGADYEGAGLSCPTGTPPPTPSTRPASCRRRNGSPSCAGSLILNMTSWGCPPRTWSSTWICPPTGR